MLPLRRTWNTYAQYIAAQNLAVNYYGGFFHDDFKLNRNVTINLGLRYEYETAPMDARDRFTRYLDLTSPIPEMQANPPAIPAQIDAMRGKPAQFTGEWLFSDSKNRKPYNAQKLNLMPRAGVALRVSNRTAVQAGYARYIVPSVTVADQTTGPQRFPGFSAVSRVLPAIEGVPAASLSDPFPAGRNPLQLPAGKSFGRYTNLGNAASWHQQDFRNGVNDRFNFTLQRELPGSLRADVTWFMHFGRDHAYPWWERPFNMADPNLLYTHKGLVLEGVPNPFYNYLTPEKFPGQLRNRQTVTVLDLLRPYPQYADLGQKNTTGMRQRYQALQMRLQRQYANGLSVLWAYNYHRERLTYFLNSTFDAYTFQDRWRIGETPRHRMSLAGTYDLPFGKGRLLLNQAHPVLNAVLGGWSTSSFFTANSGNYSLFFYDHVVEGDPRISNPNPKKWFDTSKFKPLPAFTPRTAPVIYEGVKGPKRWNLDTTLSKMFTLREGLNLEFRMEAYNLTNSFIWNDPDTGMFSSNFGKSTWQGNRGREMQYTLRLIF